MKICARCSKILKKTQLKFCSRLCCEKSRKGKSIHDKESRRIRSEKMKDVYANMTLEEREVLNDKIRQAALFKYNDKHVSKVKECIATRLNSVDHMLSKTGLSVRVLYRIIDDEGLRSEYNKRFFAIPKHIGNMSNDQQLFLWDDLENISHHEMMYKYNISEKTMIRLYIYKNIKKESKSETLPEKTVRKFLEKAGVNFLQEKYLNRTIRPDFTIGNKVIEVQGDYFHANPKIYNKEDLTDLQKRNIRNDMRKRNYYKENGYELMEVWESDLKSDPLKVEKQVVEFVKEEDTMRKLFEQEFNTVPEEMEIGEFIDVSHYGIGIESYNHDNDTIEYNRINKIIRKPDSEYYYVKSDQKILKVSDKHRMFVKINESFPEYKHVDELYELFTANSIFYLNSEKEWCAVKEITRSGEKGIILDIEVDKVHNYFSDDILSHNSYGDSDKSTGGNGWKFYARTRLKTSKSKGEAGEYAVHKYRQIKSNYGSPDAITETTISYGEGFNKVREFIKVCLAEGLIQRAGSWFSYGDVKLGQGENAVVEILQDNPELFDELFKKLKDLKVL